MLRAFAIVLMVAVAIGGSDAAIAQLDVKTYEFGKNAYGFHGMPGNRRITTFQAENEATLVFRKIIGAQGISARVEIRASGDVDNAAAFVDETGVRIIAYNAIFMDEVLKKTGRYWSLMSIMAHEVGHHLNFHTYVSATGLSPDQLRKDELEADYFSGHALARLGATLDDALAAMRAISPAIESSTHPAMAARLQAIALGWKAAAVAPPVPDAKKSEQPLSAAPRNDQVCVVTDPTGTPLNVRANPQGAILSTLQNGTSVRITQLANDQKGQEWVYISGAERGERLGWVIRRYLNCR